MSAALAMVVIGGHGLRSFFVVVLILLLGRLTVLLHRSFKLRSAWCCWLTACFGFIAMEYHLDKWSSL